MLVALDVGYKGSRGAETGRCGVVAFEAWRSTESAAELSVVVQDIREYVSGRLFERELPCLIAGLDALKATNRSLAVDCVLVDGNVRLNSQGAAGLGLHLYWYLGEEVPVVGVAKNPFAGLDAVEIQRGASAKPLYVTAAGIDEVEAAKLVVSMAGEFRLPTLIRRADQLARGTAAG